LEAVEKTASGLTPYPLSADCEVKLRIHVAERGRRSGG
jgi:hypothetical protein